MKEIIGSGDITSGKKIQHYHHQYNTIIKQSYCERCAK